MLTDLINYAVEHQGTLRTLADKLPVSTTVMHRLLNGTYQAPALSLIHILLWRVEG